MLDARYITQSDNTAVSSWADRSGNSYSADQATGGNQPTFRTAQQGGNGGIDFDGSTDNLTGSYTPAGVPRTVHIVFKADTSSEVNNLFQVPQRNASSLTSGSGWIARWGLDSGSFFIAGDITTTNQNLSVTPSNATDAIIGSWSSDSSRNVSFVRDGTNLTVTGNPPNAVATSGGNYVAGYRIGQFFNNAGNSFSQFWDGLIFSVHVWGGEQIAAPIRKRCEHASAFSFKIACN